MPEDRRDYFSRLDYEKRLKEFREVSVRMIQDTLSGEQRNERR
jgi:hypothetical protein